MNLGWSHFGSGHSSGLEATELQRGLFVRRVRGSSEAPTRSRAGRGDLAAVAGPLRPMLPPLLIPRPGQEPPLAGPREQPGRLWAPRSQRRAGVPRSRRDRCLRRHDLEVPFLSLNRRLSGGSVRGSEVRAVSRALGAETSSCESFSAVSLCFRVVPLAARGLLATERKKR